MRYFKKATWLLMAMLLPYFSFAQAQIKSLEVGDVLPKHVFENISNSNEKSMTIPNGKAKLVVLDFWATWCGACIASFPKLEKIQTSFGSDVQVVLATYEDKNLIDNFFKIRREVMKEVPILPSLCGDTILKSYFPHTTIPHTIVLNSVGKVLAITHASQLSVNVITKLLKGQESELLSKNDRLRSTLNKEKPFFLEQLTTPLYVHEGVINGYRYRSIITPYTNENLSWGTAWRVGRTFCVNEDIQSLYGVAYESDYNDGDVVQSGSFNRNKIETDVKDSGLLIWKFDKTRMDEAKQKLFCYDVVFPDVFNSLQVNVSAKDKHLFRQLASDAMKKDLDKYFGYSSKIVRKPWDVLTLTCADTSLLMATCTVEKTQILPGLLGVAVKNEPFKRFKGRMLDHIIQNIYVMDLCNYNGKVNFEFKANLTDRQSLVEGLKSVGLILEPETKKTNVLVISDR